jgi:2-polyprenyl-3-methyl-5-hydroxy-6-metoxy-1,4-benzoquinol methylase
MSIPSASPRTLNVSAAKAFAVRLGTMLDAGAVTVMISLGHRTGLFDAMASLPAATSHEIAATTGLTERYVREWLAVMVTGGVVSYDPAARTYRLPPEHAACLTRSGPIGNLAVYAQNVALMGMMQERVVASFRDGGGIHYHEYPRFHEVMAEDSGQTVTARLFDTILPLIDGIEERLETGIGVLDAGCARGSALLALARRFPASRFVGYDLCEDAIEHAAGSAQEFGLTNIRFEARDLGSYHEKERFDLVTSFDAVHDQRDPARLLRSLHEALRQNGVYLMQDIGGSAKLENNLDFPIAALLYAISCVHCIPVSLAQGGKGLGTMWGWETAEAMLRAVGFLRVDRHVLAHDPMNVWFVARRS